MTTPAAPSPPPRPDPGNEAPLSPRSWCLADEPPGPDALPVARNGSEPPLLLLLDRRPPLAAELTQQLAACLSSEERQRHDAYRLPADRQRFLLARGALRRLLGAWLQLPPQAVPLATGPHGKPHCPAGPAFNLSHSGDLILLAVHRQRPVGVDVERLRPELDWQALARRLLSEPERLALERGPAEARPEAFLAAWCRLEARLKARGTGLGGLERLRDEERQTNGAASADSASPREHQPAAAGDAPRGVSGAHAHQPQSAAAGGERVWDVRVPAGYRAAVALAPASPTGQQTG